MPTPPCVPHLPLLPGLLASFPAQSRQREAKNLTLRRQSVVRGLRRDGCMGAIGRPARSLAAKCQTNLVFPAGSASFGAKPHRRSSESWTVPAIIAWSSAIGGASRRIAVSCPCEASRAIACPGRHAEHRAHIGSSGRGEASRPLVSCFSGRARAVLPVSPVCGRRNEGA